MRKNKTDIFTDNLKAEMVEVKKRNSNYMINPVLRREFKMEVARNDTSMSTVLESLMLSYIVKSRQMHGEL